MLPLAQQMGDRFHLVQNLTDAAADEIEAAGPAIEPEIEAAENVKQLKQAGLSMRKIAKETGHDFRTVKKYLDENYNPVHKGLGKKRSNANEFEEFKEAA